MKEITLDAITDNIDILVSFIDGELEEYGCGMKEQTAIDVAVDELFSNVANYAYAPEKGQITVRIEIGGDPLSAELTFIDSGIPYDPLKKPDPNTSLSIDERPIGGLGILIVKKSMDSFTYRYEDGKNITVIKKSI